MDIVAVIAENKIKEAIRKGELKNLDGEGRPLELEDLSNVPEDLRAAYIIMKNANMMPQELELRKEIVSLQDLINCCYEDKEKKDRLRRRLNQKLLRFNLLMEKRGKSPAMVTYEDQVYDRLGSKVEA